MLAAGGIASRRAAEQLILSGAVCVDGKPVLTLGARVDPARHVVTVRGRRVEAEPRVHLALNKPPGVVCTSSDPQGRKTCLDLVAGFPVRLYTVGRLDADSEGLILLTNDGGFAFRMTHPRHPVEKVYEAEVDAPLTREQAAKFVRGIRDREELLRALRVRRLPAAGAIRYEVVLREGRNRQVRRMFRAVGRRVARLVRVRIGSLELGPLPAGSWRSLDPREVRGLVAQAVRGSR